jgi:N-acetylglucosamine repressor
MRKTNREIILNLIREKKPISRADLARATNMSPTSVSRIVAELDELGLVKETTLTSNGVGRKAMLLDTDPGSIYVISVELDKTTSKIGVVDFDGYINFQQYMKYDFHNMDWKNIIDDVCEKIEKIIEKENIQESKIAGIGIGIPGIIDNKSGVVNFSPQLKWKGIPLVKYVEKKLGFKTRIDNIIKLKALAENIYGSTKGVNKAALINFGTGVGSALIIEEEIYRGITNSSGEIGHTTIEPNGRLCDCGRRGCLQTYISINELIAEARRVKDISSLKEIFDSSSNGESWAIDILDRWYTYIGIAVCDVIYVYNPETVIISGEIIEQEPWIKDTIIDKVEKLIWEPFKDTYEIKHSVLGEKAGMIGISILVLNQYIDAELS